MTSIATPSKKRAREFDISSSMFSQHNLGIEYQLQQPHITVCSPALAAAENCNNGSFSCPSPLPNQLFSWLAGTSTSSQSDIAPDVASQLYYQCEDIDSILNLHMEQLTSGLVEARKRQCLSLLYVRQQETVKRLREKEILLEQMRQRSAELEEMARRVVSESHFWFTVAKNNEAVACSLRASLEMALNPPAEEGSGESEGIVNPAADDGQSSCHGGQEVGHQWACKSCKEGEVCMLMLPCKHLCICKDCESRIDACPVCNSGKKACLRIATS